jgi:hypothetical protein
VQNKGLHPVRNNDFESGKEKISNGVYVNRAFGGDCDYRAADGDTGARTGTGKEPGQSSGL